MRACFLGQSVCALGYGVAMIQTLPAEEKLPPEACPPALLPVKSPMGPQTPIPNRMFEDFKRQPHYS
jgi:hypothetical protein